MGEIYKTIRGVMSICRCTEGRDIESVADKAEIAQCQRTHDECYEDRGSQFCRFYRKDIGHCDKRNKTKDETEKPTTGAATLYQFQFKK
jgi:hypothetical protein